MQAPQVPTERLLSFMAVTLTSLTGLPRWRTRAPNRLQRVLGDVHQLRLLERFTILVPRHL
jgi:hypothetical protein